MSDNQEKKAGSGRVYGKPAGGKSFGKPSGSRTHGKPDGRKHDGKPSEGKAYGKVPGGKSFGKSFGKPSGGRNDGKPFKKTPDGRTDERLSGRKPFGGSEAGSERKDAGTAFARKPGEVRTDRRPAAGKTYSRPADSTAGNRAGGYALRKPVEGRPFGSPSKERQFGKPAQRGDNPRPFGDRSVRRPAPVRTVRKADPAEMEGLASRRAALKIIREVTENGAYASLILDKTLTGSGLSGADRRLASRLAYDTLDRMIYLDHMLGQVMAREDTDIKLRNILRLGACQILIEDRIPESAATNTCVQLCVENGMEGLKGVCNGILRNLVRKKDELTLPDPETDADAYFAVKNSVPEWLGRQLKEDWGEEEAEKIATWRAPESAITIRRNLLKTDEAGFEKILEKKIWGRTRGMFPGSWKITGAMDIARDADFLAGNFSIQSEPSMAVCLALGVGRGMQVLDCCAAPGGKTCYLAELMGDTGRIQAWDIHDHRVELISAQQKRLGIENIRPMMRDAAKNREDLWERMDAVLLDAPCSGLGVIAEKPDIKSRVTEEGVRELTALQEKLLDTVCRYVRPGGVLVYSTCSVLKAENEDQVRAFLERHPEFKAEPLPETIPEAFRKNEALGLQLLPHRDGVEGFYICRMRRQETELY